MKKKIFAFIFARKNSKRIKNKNIKTINNKTLLEYSINSAKQIRVIDKIYVSTDSNLMVNIAYKKKVSVIKRPKILCKDDSNELLSWKHAIDFLKMKKEKFDIFVSLPTTSPHREKKDIIKMIKTFKRTNSDLVISVTKTNRIPNYNMVKVDKSARAYLAIDKKRLKLKKVSDCKL